MMRIFLYIVLSLAVSGCFLPPEELPQNHAIEVQGAQKVQMNIQMFSGRLHIIKGEGPLLLAQYRYNVPYYKPEVEYTVTDGTGLLLMDQLHTPSIGTFSRGDGLNVWDLQLNPTVPTEIAIRQVAGFLDLKLDALELTRLVLDLEEGQSLVDLSGSWSKDVVVQINGGNGTAAIQIPKDIGIQISTQRGADTLTAPGFTAKENKLTNAQYGKTDVTFFLDVRSGNGAITIQ